MESFEMMGTGNFGFVCGSTTLPCLRRARSAACKRSGRYVGGARVGSGLSVERRGVVTRATVTEVHSEAAWGLNRILETPERRFVFVSGKGGVGKTTSSGCIATRCADSGFRTLVLSTDPAHSLGDCLDVDLSSGEVTQVSENLWALECDTAEALAEFKNALAGLKDLDDSSGDVSAAQDIANRLGLNEFGEILSTLPPGADEFVALAKVLRLAEESDQGYDRIVIDTAPTGHTLRLLAFPDFLDNFLEKVNGFRARLDTAKFALDSISTMLGSKKFSDQALSKAAERVDQYRERMMELSDMFRDPSRCEFVVVAIPTRLSVNETRRLLAALTDEGIWVRNLIVNQLVTESVSDVYAQHLIEGQKKQIRRIEEDFPDLAITKIYRFDLEVRGVYGLRSFAEAAFGESKLEASWPGLFDVDNAKSGFVFVGGKGGVGKTSTSAAMGVKLATKGIKTLVISTDPAHSLSDSLGVSLDGQPTLVDGTDGNLYGMEIDTEAAVNEFKALVRRFVEEGAGLGAEISRKFGLEEFSGILENTPPGIDELVALTQVVGLVKSGQFQRVVVDTAPTGHTLRLLAFPDFLDGFLGRVLRLKKRIDSVIDSVKNVFSGPKQVDVNKAAEKIEQFRRNMVDLRVMFKDPERTQFCVVTIPTELAVAETERLVGTLRSEEIKVNNLIVNQILPESAAGGYVKRRFAEQKETLKSLEELAEGDLPLHMARATYFDEEVRGVDRLRKMASVLFGPQEEEG